MDKKRKVKIFVGGDATKLEAKINSFLATPVKILQVAQTETIEDMGARNEIWLTITIFYEEE